MDVQRWKTAGILTVVLSGIVLLSGFSWVLPLAAFLFCIMAVFELLSVSKADMPRWAVLLCFLAAVLPLLPIPGYGDILLVLFPVICLLFLWLMTHLQGVNLQRSGICIALAFVICLFARALPVVRELEHGLWYLILAVCVCVLADSAGYFCGKRFGRRKMAPRISPNKTIAGGIGGLVSSVAGAALLGWRLRAEGTGLLLWAVCAALIAQFGDLALSAVKRNLGIKDFSRMLPGHGGLLDRFDSVLFVLPFTVLYIHLTGGFLS